MEASLGGDDQRLNRMGSRWGCDFQTKPLKGEDARIWISRLVAGCREKAIIKFPQPGVLFPTGATAIALAAAANAEIVKLGLGEYHEGQFFSVIHLGKNYLYQLRGDGTELVQIQPPLRSALTVADVVALENAKIEGYVKGDRASWSIDNAKIYGLRFKIEEAS